MSLRVMTLNLRYATADDGEFSWPHRKASLFAMLRDTAPDVIATQEGITSQLDEIADACPGYRWYGVGRDDGEAKGEYCAIFVRETLPILEQGTFWLSDTPDVPGSITWDHHCVRVATWVRLDNAWIVNLHLDHESEFARNRGVELVLSRFSRKSPLVLCGDFNAEPDSTAIQLVRDAGFLDVLNYVTEPTFHGYAGGDGPRIDYILLSPGMTATEARVVRHRPVYSDHDAVIANLVM